MIAVLKILIKRGNFHLGYLTPNSFWLTSIFPSDSSSLFVLESLRFRGCNVIQNSCLRTQFVIGMIFVSLLGGWRAEGHSVIRLEHFKNKSFLHNNYQLLNNLDLPSGYFLFFCFLLFHFLQLPSLQLLAFLHFFSVW